MTSEKLRAVIETAIIRANGVANHTIVAGANRPATLTKAATAPCAPMNRSSWIFSPARRKRVTSGTSRATVVAGAPARRFASYTTPFYRAQQAAFRQNAAGRQDRRRDKSVQELFTKAGYKTGRSKAGCRASSTAPATRLGLEIHEPPRTGRTRLGS